MKMKLLLDRLNDVNNSQSEVKIIDCEDKEYYIEDIDENEEMGVINLYIAPVAGD